MTKMQFECLGLKRTRAFLVDLLDPKETPSVPLKVRRKARHLLCQWPSIDMEGQPIFTPERQ